MTGISYKVEIQDAELDAFLRDQLAKMENLRPFYVNVGEHMLNSVDDRFQSETAPDGSAWQAHSPVTVANRLHRYGNAPLTILRASGRLAGSFNYEATSRQVSIGTPVVYAAIHHYGGKAGRNRKVAIPARPVLGVSPRDEVAIGEIAEDFLRN